MPKKKSVQLCTRHFREETKGLLEFCREAEKELSDAHTSLAYDTAIIKLYAAFEQMMIDALTGAINNDTAILSETTNVDFPKHLTDEVCEYIITGGRYFDFRGRDGLIREIKRYVPENHYLVETVKNGAYQDSIDQLCALRNYAAHDSSTSKQAALKAIDQQRIGSAGSWLKVQNRFSKIANSLSKLSEIIEKRAPY